MLFNSFEFILLFLPFVFVAFYLIGARSHFYASLWLAIASLFFYSWWSIKMLPLLLISITINYWFGKKLTEFNNCKKGKFFLISAITLNLGLLGYFKYAGLFVTTLNAGLTKVGMIPLTIPQIILPIGISFYTFTQIAFLVDCWQGKVNERRFLHYLLFVTYFPHLIAGPILHHSQMMPQFAKPATYQINYNKLIIGLVIFTIGLFKKMIIADPLSEYADQLFKIADTGSESISLYTAWAGVLSYAFQIYFDFSGYSDMAIGISLFFGIHIPINFNSPYRSTSIIEFWRRWHISLSTFLREYLYIPLGGNQNGKCKRYINLLITMILGGLWHGASWNFALWGGLHGLYLTINHAWRKLFPKTDHVLYNGFSWLITFIAVCFAWVLFRANTLDGAKRIYAAMLGLTNHDSTTLVATLNFLHADALSKLVSFINDSRLSNISIEMNLIDLWALIVAWLYSTLRALLSISTLDGLQYLFVALVIALLPFNSNAIAYSINGENKSVEKTYILACLVAALYILISCLWIMNKHTVFIYFQF